jgi:hypothetical protein
VDGRIILTMDFEEVDGEDVDWIYVVVQDTFYTGEHGNETSKFMKGVKCCTR